MSLSDRVAVRSRHAPKTPHSANLAIRRLNTTAHRCGTPTWFLPGPRYADVRYSAVPDSPESPLWRENHDSREIGFSLPATRYVPGVDVT